MNFPAFGVQVYTTLYGQVSSGSFTPSAPYNVILYQGIPVKYKGDWLVYGGGISTPPDNVITYKVYI